MQSAGYAISYNGTHAAVTAFLNQACFTGKVNLFSLTVLQPRNTHRSSSSKLEVNAKRNQKSGSFAQGERKGINFQKKKCALLVFCLKEAHRQGAVGNLGCCACAITSGYFLVSIVAPISIKYLFRDSWDSKHQHQMLLQGQLYIFHTVELPRSETQECRS